MTRLYCAYGSNLWLPRLLGRCPRARPTGTATLDGWQPVYDKPSIDGSSKLNIRPSEGSTVYGAVYQVDEEQLADLDAAEPRYRRVGLTVMASTPRSGRQPVFVYRWTGEPSSERPFDWYVDMVVAGARHHGLPPDYIEKHLEAAVMTSSRPDEGPGR